jgi:predicted transcriptional regulator
MTALFEKAIASVRELPVDAQDALARMLLEYVGGDRSTIELTEAEASSFDESLAQADRGEFASDEQIRAIWARHGL